MDKILNAGSRLVYITDDNAAMLDSETIGISNIYIIPKDSHLIWRSNRTDKTIEKDLHRNDIFITLYDNDLDEDFVVVNSDDWLKALNNAKANNQKRKEEWAAKQSNCKCCKSCECD